jgi:hypothetical protein
MTSLELILILNAVAKLADALADLAAEIRRLL